MPWVRLDDSFTDHPKIIEAGPLAGWLYVCGLTYCNRHQTDGRIPAGVVRRLADVDDGEALAERLVAVNLWERVEGGYQVHDYTEYQPTREHIDHVRAVRAEAGSRGGKQRAANAAEANAKQIATAVSQAKSKPNPSQANPSQGDSLPSTVFPEGGDARAPAETPAAPAPSPRYSPGFELFWRAYPGGGRDDKPGTFTVYKKLRPDEALHGEIMAGLERWKASRRWQEGVIVAPKRWLAQRRWESEPEPATGPARASPRASPSPPAAKPTKHELVMQVFGRQSNDGGPPDGSVVYDVAASCRERGPDGAADVALPRGAERPVGSRVGDSSAAGHSPLPALPGAGGTA